MAVDQEEIHRLSLSENVDDRFEAARLLGSKFSSLPDKSAALADLFRLSGDKNSSVKETVFSFLLFVPLYSLYNFDSTFVHVPDISTFWDNLIEFEKENPDRFYLQSDSILVLLFSHASDKSKAWRDIIELTKIKKNEHFYYHFPIIRNIFPEVPHKFQASKNLHDLTYDTNANARLESISAIMFNFMLIPDKSQALSDVHRLVGDEDANVRLAIAKEYNLFFHQIPSNNKPQAWEDLMRLICDKNSAVSSSIAECLLNVSSQIPEKSQLWRDLIGLLKHAHGGVVWYIHSVLLSTFSHLPDKSRAWNELIELTHNDDTFVRTASARILSIVYPDISPSIQVWDDFQKLTQAEDSSVRMFAYHSLGKISIDKASKCENEDEIRSFVEAAISFFEKATDDMSYYNNPAKFCHPFYRSFYSVVMKKSYSTDEIQDFIVSARKSIGKSKSKEKLLESIEKLAEVLGTAQNIGEAEIDHQELLKHCSDICSSVDQLMEENKEKTPAICGLYGKFRPSFRKTIKELIDNTKEKAEEACREAKGTAAQQAICEINRKVQELRIGDQTYMKKQVQTLNRNLKSSVPDKEEYKLIHLEIDSILNEQDLVNQYCSLNMLLPKIIQINVVEATCSVADEIKLLREAVDKLIELVDELQNPQEYVDVILRNLEEIKDEIPGMKKQIDEVLYELYSPMGVDQKLKVALPIIPMLVSYELEMNAPKFLVDRIDDLKKLVMKGKK